MHRKGIEPRGFICETGERYFRPSEHRMYPPGNGYISHLGEGKIIFKKCLGRGYVSSLEGITSTSIVYVQVCLGFLDVYASPWCSPKNAFHTWIIKLINFFQHNPSHVKDKNTVPLWCFLKNLFQKKIKFHLSPLLPSRRPLFCCFVAAYHPHRIHGTGIFTYIDPIKITHSCR